METLIFTIMWICLGIAGLFVAALIFASVHELIWPSPILDTLKKAEWECSISHAETYTTMMLVGKIMVPMQHTQTVCDRYDRKK